MIRHIVIDAHRLLVDAAITCASLKCRESKFDSKIFEM